MPVKNDLVNEEGQEILSIQKRVLGQLSEMNEKSKGLVPPGNNLRPPSEEDVEKEEMKKEIEFLKRQYNDLASEHSILGRNYRDLHAYTKKLHAKNAINVKKNDMLQEYVESLETQLKAKEASDEESHLDGSEANSSISSLGGIKDEPIKLGRVLKDDDSTLPRPVRVVKRFNLNYNFHLEIETNLARQLAIINEVEVASYISHKPEEFDVTQMIEKLTAPQIPEHKKGEGYYYPYRDKKWLTPLESRMRYITQQSRIENLAQMVTISYQTLLKHPQPLEDFGNGSSQAVEEKSGKRKKFKNFFKKVVSRFKFAHKN